MTSEECARNLMEAVPLVMRFIKSEMRRQGGLFASVPQFRALGFVHRHREACLSDVAAHLGVTPATASAIIDRLVRYGLVSRAPDPRERRRIVLTLTRAGNRHLGEARAATRRRLAQALAGLPAAHLSTVSAAAAVLSRAFRDHAVTDGD